MLHRQHNITKFKGTLAELKVASDLQRRGFIIGDPAGDMLPFDMLAIDPSSDYAMYKVQVKYVDLVDGKIKVDIKKTYLSAGMIFKTKHYSPEEVDVFAVYVPSLERCLYFSSDVLESNKTMLTINTRQGRNNQHECHLIKDYGEFPCQESRQTKV